MTHFSLAHLTVLSVSPPDVIRIAARTGYQTVGLRLIRVTDTTPGYPLMDDPVMLRDTLAAIRDTGVGVLDIEFVQIRPETEIQSLLPFLETGAALGAKWIVAAPYDANLGRLADRFAALCDLAAPFGMRIALEFFPWTVVPGIAEADAILDAADRPNSGILVDTLHFDRGPSTLEALAVIGQERLPFLHLCDAPVAPSWTTEELLHAARAERLAPGDGGIDLPSLIAAMPHSIPPRLGSPHDRADDPHRPGRRGAAGSNGGRTRHQKSKLLGSGSSAEVVISRPFQIHLSYERVAVTGEIARPWSEFDSLSG